MWLNGSQIQHKRLAKLALNFQTKQNVASFLGLVRQLPKELSSEHLRHQAQQELVGLDTAYK